MEPGLFFVLELDSPIPGLVAHAHRPAVVERGNDERGPKLAGVRHPQEHAGVDEELPAKLAEDAVIGRGRHQDALLGPRAVLENLVENQRRLAVVFLAAGEAHKGQPVYPLSDLFSVGEYEPNRS